MPVYLLTVHAYCSWSEDNPRGYVQRGEGLKAPDPDRAEWRRENAKHPPVRFDRAQQLLAHEVVCAITAEKSLRHHATSTTPTHVHTLASFKSPACTCGALAHCKDGCPARTLAERYLTRFKQKLGQQLAKAANTTGRPYLSRGWDISPVRERQHFDYLIAEYLPKHEKEEGIFRRYD
jgi:hypothetical protein